MGPANAASGDTWLLPRGDKVSGLLKGSTIREGFALAMADMRYNQHANYEHPGGGFFKLQCKLKGKSALSGEDREFQSVEAGSLAVLVQPSDSLKYERVSVDTHERSVTLICSRDFMANALPKSRAAEAPVLIDEFLHNRISQFSLKSLPLPHRMRAIVEDILSPMSPESMSQLMLEAKSLELLSLGIDQMIGPASAAIVRARDRRKVQELCAFLEEGPASPVSMAELAKMFAWNETQMMECFKRITGHTIFSYRQNIRMHRARRQLHETDASITDIALDAGYEHPSNFATAYKRAFGVSPRTARSRVC